MMFPKKKWGWSKTDKHSTDRKKLIAKLDRIFSKYIRLKYSDRNGYCRCVTCPKVAPWKEMDAGHFISREKMAVRFDERNVHPQCLHCNRFKAGNQYEHGKAVDRIHGKGTADLLSTIGRARGGKVDSYYIEKLIEEYKEKTKNLHKE